VRTCKKVDYLSINRNPTTSFLTAATLVYTIGAGITAAAGTRLALQWFLDNVFKLHSFQTQHHLVLSWYLLSLAPRIEIR